MICDDNDKTSYPSGVCPAQNYCPGGATPSTCDSTSDYCPTGMIQPKNIPTGSLSSDTLVLQDCPQGFFCIDNVQTPCESKYYCPVGTKFLIPCGRDGTSCPGFCTDKKYCPGDGEQYDCIDGFTCQGTITKYPTALCQPPNFCIGGEQLLCNTTQYQPGEGQSECINCPKGGDCQNSAQIYPEECPAGHYCGEGNKTPCPPGTYRPASAIAGQAVSDCILCPYGFYCPNSGTTEPLPCTAGECKNGSSSDNSSACPDGYMCQNGKKILCPAGQHPDGSNQCVDCSSGSYCPSVGREIPCDPGYFCPVGTSVLSPDYICQVGKVCPIGSDTAQNCAAGNKTIEIKQDECIFCDSGYFCDGLDTGTGTVENICSPGSFCPVGSVDDTNFCLEGTFGNQQGLQSSLQCQPCTVGKYCDGLDGTEKDCPSVMKSKIRIYFSTRSF